LIWQSLACTAACGNHRHLPPDEVSGERGQLVVLPPCPSVFDQNASPFDEALFGCCARAASGHAAAAPSAANNLRRPMVTVMRPSRARVRKCNDTTDRKLEV
jgi:hypothetical protein